jgi:hypothetical protein
MSGYLKSQPPPPASWRGTPPLKGGEMYSVVNKPKDHDGVVKYAYSTTPKLTK